MKPPEPPAWTCGPTSAKASCWARWNERWYRLYVEIPDGYEIQVRPRSGLAARHGISLVNSPGTIDPDYRGEIKAILVNLSDEPFEIKPGERIAQLVVARFERAEWESVETLGETARGEGGMGSTGRG